MKVCDLMNEKAIVGMRKDKHVVVRQKEAETERWEDVGPQPCSHEGCQHETEKKCLYCGVYYCAEHRMEEVHDCKEAIRWNRRMIARAAGIQVE